MSRFDSSMRRAGRTLTFGLLALLLTGTGAGTVLAEPAPSRAAPGQSPAPALLLVNQQFVVDAGSLWGVTVRLPTSVDPTLITATTTLEISNYLAIDDRTTFWEARDGTPTLRVDAVELPLDPTSGDPRIQSSNAGEWVVTLPTEWSTRTAPALRFNDRGIHPVIIRIRDGGTELATVTTFVDANVPTVDAADPTQVTPAVGARTADLQIALMMGQTSPVALANDGSVEVTAANVADLTALADTLTAVDTATGGDTTRAGVPRHVDIEPATLQALSAINPELAARLVPLLEPSTIAATASPPFDPSTIVPAAHDDTYTSLLRRGETELTTLLASAAIDRSVQFVPGEISVAGAGRQRDLGTRMLVLPYTTYEGLKGSLGLYTDTTQLIDVDLGDETTMSAAVIDPFLAQRLATPGDDRLRSAIDIAAELLVIADQIAASGGLVAHHGLVLATPTIAPPDSSLMTYLMPLLRDAAGLRLVSTSNLVTGVDTLLYDGLHARISLPPTGPIDLTARFALIDAISAETYTVASMLPESVSTIDGWVATVESLPSTALTDAQAATMIDDVRADLDSYRACVRAPEKFTFTLTGTTGSIPFTVTNSCDVPVTVRIQLDAPKIEFPDGELTIVLAPDDQTSVRIRAQARSNGTSNVFLRIFAPAHQSNDAPLVPQVVLTARSNSLAGIAQLLTGGGLIVLITWWYRHWSRTRRSRQVNGDALRHPAAGN